MAKSNWDILKEVYDNINDGKVYKNTKGFEQLYMTDSGHICYDGYGRFCVEDNFVGSIAYLVLCHYNMTPQEFITQYKCE